MKPTEMKPKRPARGKLYTVEEANASLPLVRAIVSDLVGLSREVSERRNRLSLLRSGTATERNRRDLYQEELVQIEEELQKDGRRLREYVDELRALGVEPASGSEGLVDFPAMVNGRRAFLCWKLGEPEVRYWHDPDAGYRQRHPLGADSA
jgi:hypothetical protein